VFLQTGPAVRSDKALNTKNICTGVETVLYKGMSSSNRPGTRFTRAAGGSWHRYDRVPPARLPGDLVPGRRVRPEHLWALAGGNIVIFDWQTD
jgi:hypothetical protein